MTISPHHGIFREHQNERPRIRQRSSCRVSRENPALPGPEHHNKGPDHANRLLPVNAQTSAPHACC